MTNVYINILWSITSEAMFIQQNDSRTNRCYDLVLITMDFEWYSGICNSYHFMINGTSNATCARVHFPIRAEYKRENKVWSGFTCFRGISFIFDWLCIVYCCHESNLCSKIKYIYFVYIMFLYNEDFVRTIFQSF